MAGDHGLAPVKYALNPEKAVFGSLQEEGYEMLINKISSDEGEDCAKANSVSTNEASKICILVWSVYTNLRMDYESVGAMVIRSNMQSRCVNLIQAKHWIKSTIAKASITIG